MYGKILIQCDLIVRTGMHIARPAPFPRSVRSTVLLSAIRSREIQSFPAAASRESSARCWQEVFSGDIEHMPDFKNDEAPILRLFGSADPVRAARLQFADCFVNNKEQMKAVGLTEVKFENAINRINSVANPRQIERVVPGTSFGVNIVYELAASAKHRKTLHCSQRG